MNNAKTLRRIKTQIKMHIVINSLDNDCECVEQAYVCVIDTG